VGTARKFVKYRNRKLHEEGSMEPYISMEKLGEIAASGGEVLVLDDATGKDLTAATLARILYDRVRSGSAVKVEAIQKLLVESRHARHRKAA
jgi:polyhydroxyalkanoate synthesis regulator protein